MKKIAILQSNYIPWKGVFDMMNKVDIFVFFEDVDFTKRDWRTRNKIKTPEGEVWLSIPVKKSSRGTKIYEIEISQETNWQEKHYQTIVQYYKKAKFFPEYKWLLDKIYLEKKWENLSEFNIYVNTLIARELGIKTTFINSKDLETNGTKGDKLIEIIKKLDGDFYLSGPAAKDYIVNEKFKDVSRAFSEAIDNIKIGSKLLLGNIGGTLIIGSARQMIEIYWGIETFGKISLALSISNMLMVLISGISLVLYPMIKNVSRDRVHSLYPFLLCSAKIVIMWGLLLYFPCEKIFTWWLPLYKESFLYMALLFPIGLYYLLSATYLKAFRKEKVLLIINWLTVLVEIILLLLARNSLICIVLTILISLGLRCYLGLGYLSRILNQKFWKDFLWDIFMVSCFVYCAWTKKYICVFIYVISLYLYMMRNKQWKDLFI